MNTFLTKFFAILLIGWMSIAGVTESKACDRSRLTLDSVTAGPSGSYYIYLRLCVGRGILGLLKGADGNTGRFLFSFSSSTPGFSVMSFTSPIRSDFTNVPYNGVNVGAQPAFHAQQAIFYNNTSNWFGCITTTVACGNVATECDQVRFQVNSLPDSIRIYGIEGGDNLFGGCYPNISMLVDLTNLPVEWANFEARNENGGVALNWTTLSEYNNSHYDVVRSADGFNYTKIAEVRGAGNASGVSSYDYFDQNPLPGQNYYRIRQIDFDGQSSQSEVATLFYTPPSGLAWKSFGPNPADDRVDFTYQVETNRTLKLELTDLSGRNVFTDELQAYTGVNTYQLNISNMKAGIYHLRLYNNTGILEKKLVVL